MQTEVKLTGLEFGRYVFFLLKTDETIGFFQKVACGQGRECVLMHCHPVSISIQQFAVRELNTHSSNDSKRELQFQLLDPRRLEMLEPTTATEVEEVEQLKELLKDVESKLKRFDDGEHLYLRWLRAKKHKINDAAEAIRKYLKHRETFELETIEDWEPREDARQHLQYEFIGYDDESCPVCYMPWGRWDMKKLIELDCGGDEIKRLCQITEMSERKMLTKTLELGKRVPGLVFLLDLDSFSLRSVLSKAAIDIIIETAIMMDTYYTSTNKVCAVVNVPEAFFYIWKIVKPVGVVAK